MTALRDSPAPPLWIGWAGPTAAAAWALGSYHPTMRSVRWMGVRTTSSSGQQWAAVV